MAQQGVTCHGWEAGGRNKSACNEPRGLELNEENGGRNGWQRVMRAGGSGGVFTNLECVDFALVAVHQMHGGNGDEACDESARTEPDSTAVAERHCRTSA